MSLANYADLKTSVATWLNRSDLSGAIPDFIAIAESKLSRVLKCRQMDAETVLTTVQGSPLVALPQDLIAIKSVQQAGGDYPPMEYMTPDAFRAHWALAMTGTPSVYTVIANDLKVAPTPNAAYAIDLTYRKRIPSLSDSVTTNWFLALFPDAYLYGSLIGAQPFLMNDERLPVFQTLFQQAVDEINGADWNAVGPLVMR